MIASILEDEGTDSTVILLLIRLREKYLADHQHLHQKCFIVEIKLIYSIIRYHLRYRFNTHINVERLGFQQPGFLVKLIENYVQKVNQVVMQHYEVSSVSVEQQSQDEKYLKQTIELLMTQDIVEHFERINSLCVLAKMKVMVMSNLSCIYKKKLKLGIALRAVCFALKIEEEMLKEQASEEKYQIIPTYLNKAAIYSQMKKHPQAIQEISKAKNIIEVIEQEVQRQIESSTDQPQKKRLAEKRYYGLYMKMIINYNMGVEKEHLRQFGEAVDYYLMGKQLAIIIGNSLMTAKFQKILVLLDGRREMQKSCGKDLTLRKCSDVKI